MAIIYNCVLEKKPLGNVVLTSVEKKMCQSKINLFDYMYAIIYVVFLLIYMYSK